MHVAQAALNHGQLDLALEALRGVTPEDQARPPFKLLAAQVSDAAGLRPQAHRFFDEVEAGHPTDDRTLLALAQWHAKSANREELDRARSLAMALSQHGSLRLAAGRLLVDVELRRQDVKGALRASDRVMELSAAALPDRIRRLDILSANAVNLAAVEAALGKVMQTKSRTEVAQVVRWMITHDRAESALIWIRTQPEESQDDPILGAVRADCLTALGEWEHLAEIQAADHWPGQEAERLMILSRACFAEQHKADGRAAWHEAVLACRDLKDYSSLLKGTEQDDEKAEVWAALVDHYPDQTWALRQLLQYHLARKDLIRSQAIYAQLIRLNPADVTLAARGALLDLLRGGDGDRTFATLRNCRQRDPRNPVVATAVAYDFYLRGDFNQALATIGGLTPEELAAPERAVYRGALLAVGGPMD